MKKVHIEMLKSENGSEDGITVKAFVEGKKYETTKRLADVFVKMKAAKMIDAPKETKVKKKAPETKAK